MNALKTVLLSISAIVSIGHAVAQPETPSQQSIQLNNLNVAYTEVGIGRPIVLLHGGGLTSKMWSQQVEALAKNHRVIMPETRGHGHTDNPNHIFDYKQLAIDVANFCHALKLEKPIVMGYSDGGVTALTLAVHHPEVASAFVIGGAVPPASHKDVAHYLKGMDLYYAPVTKRTAINDADLDSMYNTAPKMWDFMAKMHAKPHDVNYWRTLMKDVWLTWNQPQNYAYLNQELTKTQVPMLVILGDRDEFFRAENAARLVESLPKGELAVIPHAGHDVFRSKPHLFNALVLDFINRLDTPKP